MRMNPESSLRPSYCIDSDNKAIIRKASALISSIRNAREKVRRIFRFVRDEIPYNFAPAVSNRSHFRASHTLELGTGFCMQKAALFAALCRASGIPARIGFQHIRDYMIAGGFLRLMGTNELSPHGMNAVYLNGRWVMADCTLDSGLANRKRYRLVDFDGARHALLPKTTRTGKPHFDILKQYGFYNDTPLFASNSMLKWVKEIPQKEWHRLVHRKDGSM